MAEYQEMNRIEMQDDGNGGMVGRFAKAKTR